MPILTNDFTKGKMNKDLDERLVPSGEYRDALNIKVSTSEEDDAGTVSNILGNTILDKNFFLKPTWVTSGRPIYTSSYSLNQGVLSSNNIFIEDPAEVVGSYLDEQNDAIYSFVKHASGFTQNKVTDGGVDYYYYEGVRSDCILQTIPQERHMVGGRNTRIVFTDAYEVRIKPEAAFSGQAFYQGGNGSAVYRNGLEVGMFVQLVAPDEGGNADLDATLDYNDVGGYDADTFITKIEIINGTDTTTNKVKIHFNRNLIVTSSQINDGAVLRFFKKQRLLNFESGSSRTYTDTDDNVRVCNDPTSMITAIDVIDDMLFFTDGRNEPKKINITRSIRGTSYYENENTATVGGIFNTTEVMIPVNKIGYTLGSDFVRGGITQLHHITVIKKAPILPLSFELDTSDRFGITSVNCAAADYSSAAVNGFINVNFSSGQTFEIGDVVTLTAASPSNDVIDGTIVAVTGASPNVTHFKIQITNIAGAPISSGTQVYGVVTRSLEGFHSDEFVRFAYRYRFTDGELSPISPYTKPVFLPAVYGFDAGTGDGFNAGMVNQLGSFALKNFRSTYTPSDVIEVDLLMKKENSANIFYVKTVKGFANNIKFPNGNAITKTVNSQPVDLLCDQEWIEEGSVGNPSVLGTAASWALEEDSILTPDGVTVLASSIDTSSHLFTTTTNKGSIVINQETFGSTIPSNQALRVWDAVPITAKAQAFSAQRLIYGNYTQSYNLVSGGERVNPKIFCNVQEWKTTTQGEAEESIKSDRTYQVGLVYKDQFGRETPVIIDDDSSFVADQNQCDRNRKIFVGTHHKSPDFATHYKYYVKETSNEYYNLALYRFFTPSQQAIADANYIWLLFNSSDVNKVKVGDFLRIKKFHQVNTGVTYNDNQAKIKILEITSNMPDQLASSGLSDEDKQGRFFVRVHKHTGLLTGTGGALGTGNSAPVHSNPAVFETIPDPDREVNIFHEVGQAYPIFLDPSNIFTFLNIGDEVIGEDKTATGDFADLVKTKDDGGGTQTNTTDKIYLAGATFTYDDNFGTRIQLTFKTAAGTSAGLKFQSNANEAKLFFIREDGSRVFLEVMFNGGAAGTGQPGAYGTSAQTIVFVTPFTHNNGATDDGITGGAFLPWHNCYCFGNGVESDRIRDDFNQDQIGNGPKVSTTLPSYGKENRQHGLIFSEVYNTNSRLNNLNQFLIAEPITKDLNPVHGSIQKLYSRDTDILTFCEDKVLKILSNKNLLFNADGAANVSNNKSVLGTAVPFLGDFGISKNPESFAADEFRCYFMDRARGAVLRLSKDGLTPISEVGMKDYFRDNLINCVAGVGSFNGRRGEYDLCIHTDVGGATKKVETLSFDEGQKGWVSFKSYVPEHGQTLDGVYYTFKRGILYEHLSSKRNTFYPVQIDHCSVSSGSATLTLPNASLDIAVGDTINFVNHPGNNFVPTGTTVSAISGTTVTMSENATSSSTDVVVEFAGRFYNSTVTTIFNEQPSSVKSFQTLAYEGSQSKIVEQKQHTGDFSSVSSDNQFYNNSAVKGWFASSLETNLQSGRVPEFIEKENKWFNYIKGVETTFTNVTSDTSASGNVDSREFSVQGIARVASSSFAGDVTPGSYFRIRALTTGYLNDAPNPNVYNISESVTIDGVQVVSNPSGTVTLTPTQTLSSTAFDILFKPVPGFSISAADFYIRGGNAGSTADASSGTVFTHGTNGITLNSTAGDRPLTSVTFHNTVAANDPANNVRATLLLGNTGTLSADLDYFLDIANDVIALPDPARYRLTTVLTLYDTSGADLPSFTSYTNGSNMEGGAIFDTGVTTSSLTKQRQIHFVGLGISHSTPTLMGTIRLTAPSGRKFSNDIINNGFDIAAISNQLEPLTEDVTQYHFTQVMSSSDTIIDINIFYRNQGQPSLPGSSSGVVGISKKSVGGSLTQST
jgi:hypothetical protein